MQEARNIQVGWAFGVGLAGRLADSSVHRRAANRPPGMLPLPALLSATCELETSSMPGGARRTSTPTSTATRW